jgi:two-component system OmpR family response regulator/two-component system response regulator QseB
MNQRCILVWDIPTRLFHWLLAASFAGAWLTGDSERWRDLHVLLGYGFAGLIAFRVVWGVVGNPYARFRSFLFRPGEVVQYARSLLTGSPRHYLGHNPIGGVVIFLLLGLGAATAASGWAYYGEISGEWLEELHEGAATAMLALVGVHIVGVLVSSLLHRENLVRAMITGRKTLPGGERRALSMRILVVEDDGLLGDAVQAGLRELGNAVDWVRNGVAASAALDAERYDGVVLDLGLPRRSGLEVLQRLRARGDRTPVLILTARDTVAERIQGLDAGADDYLVKPFDLGELAARLRAITRRQAGQPTPQLELGPLRLDPASRAVTLRGAPVDLSVREFALLEALMRGAGRVLTRAQLEQALYAWGDEVESNAIEVHVHHLRRKLESGLIQTVRGVGYMMPRELAV